MNKMDTVFELVIIYLSLNKVSYLIDSGLLSVHHTVEVTPGSYIGRVQDGQGVLVCFDEGKR